MDVTHTVFHAGEAAVQRRDAVPERTRAMAARAIATEMAERHRAFFAGLPLVFTALLDATGMPWALPVMGAPGFVHSPSPGQLVIAKAPPLAALMGLSIGHGAKIGVLGIDFATRKRVRLNGSLHGGDSLTLRIAVEQCFGNCPKYIRPRRFDIQELAASEPSVDRVAAINGDIVGLIARSDTFFIASRSAGLSVAPIDGLDISHRGGPPGVLRLASDGSLCFADFPGNRYFNTLGNIEADGRIGLFVPDPATGDGLLISGQASIDWCHSRIAAFENAERIVDIAPRDIFLVRRAMLVPLR
jgi:predicted pyridoxine 5'-phosphate oxidase superfamily flavin-nucleotide-binding protein